MAARLACQGLALAMVLAAGTTWAFPPTLKRERALTVRLAAQDATSRMFELARLAVPVCPVAPSWRLGLPPVVMPNPEQDPFSKQVREKWLQGVTLERGELVFVERQSGTPYALAGVQPGDRVMPADLIGMPAAGEPGPEMATLAETKEFFARKAAESRALAAQPDRRLNVRRGAQTLTLTARAVPVCEQQLLTLDSEYAYADVYGGAVVITVPLLSRLTDAELTMVLAHELAQRLVGNKGEYGRSLAAGLLVPEAVKKLQNFNRNTELDNAPPAEELLVDADRLALRLLAPYGLTAADYLALLQRLQALEAPKVGAPVYSRTRPLTGRRLAELQAVAVGSAVQAPTRVESSKLAALDALGSELRTAQALTLPNASRPVVPVPAATTIAAASPPAVASRPAAVAAASATVSAAVAAPAGAAASATHRLPVPAASGFAQGDDVEAVPLSAQGRERYRHYLTLPSPKAFVIYAGGGWRFYFGQAEAMTLALDRCAREGKPCWLYAVDHQVVWQPDEARRIGSSAQLRSLTSALPDTTRLTHSNSKGGP